MRRSRRAPAPHFRQPAPFSPIGGKHAKIGWDLDPTRVSMMQIVEERENYLICRGWDVDAHRPEERRFVWEIAVAKPYVLQVLPWHTRTVVLNDGREVTYTYWEHWWRTAAYDDGTVASEKIHPPYFVGDILVCAKPRTKIGDTPGSPDGPDLGEDELDRHIDIMLDDEGNPIWYTDLNAAGRTWAASVDEVGIRRVCLAEDHPGCGVKFKVKIGTWNPDTDGWDYDDTEELAAAEDEEYEWQQWGIDWFFGGDDFTYPPAGATAACVRRESSTTPTGYIWEALSGDCDTSECGGLCGEGGYY